MSEYYQGASNKGIMYALGFFTMYYCLYDFTTAHSVIPTTISNSIVLLSILFVLLLLCIKTNIHIISKSSIPWIPFILVVVANCFTNDNMAKSYMLLYIIFLFMVANPYINSVSFDGLIKWIKVMGVVAIVGIVIQMFVPSVYNTLIHYIFSSEGVNYVNTYAGRGYYSGLFHQVGDAAFYVSASIIAFVYLSDYKYKKYVLIALFIGLFLLSKRSLVFALVFSVLVTFLITGSNVTTKIGRGVIVLLLAIVFVYLLRILSGIFIDIKFFEKMAYSLDFLSEGDVDGILLQSGRLDLYDYAKLLFHENFLTGIGWGEFIEKSSMVDPGGHNTSVHNIYLQLLCETGVIGFGSFVFGAACSLVSSIKAKKMIENFYGNEKDLYYSLFKVSFSGQLLFLLFGFVENPLYNENNLLFYFLMIFINYVLIENMKRRRIVQQIIHNQ